MISTLLYCLQDSAKLDRSGCQWNPSFTYAVSRAVRRETFDRIRRFTEKVAAYLKFQFPTEFSISSRGVIIKEAHMGASLMSTTYDAITSRKSSAYIETPASSNQRHLKNHQVSGKINDLGRR